MRNYIIVAWIMLCCLCAVSCNKLSQSDMDILELATMENLYCSNNISVAGCALTNYLISMKEKTKKEYDRNDYVLRIAMTYGRMYLLNKKECDFSSMQYNYLHCVSNLIVWRKRESLPKIDYTTNIVEYVVQQYDAHLDIKWKQVK